MKKVISTVLACTVLFGLAACNTTETSVTTTSEETTVTETTEETTEATEETTEPVETTVELKYDGMIKQTLDEITNKFYTTEFDPKHDGHKLLKTQMDPELASKNALSGIKDYFRINYDYSEAPSDEKEEPWYKYNVYIIELDMDIYHYKHLETGSKISFLTDADTSIDCTVLYVRGQYVLCIPAAEEDDYQKMLNDSPAYNNVEFERACLNFQHGS